MVPFVLTRLDEVNVYGQDLPESLARDEFLRRIGPYFVLASAWKYLESNQGSDGKLLLDHFGCDVTGGSERVLSANPIVYMHGVRFAPLNVQMGRNSAQSEGIDFLPFYRALVNNALSGSVSSQ